jgi:hypothetical protein
MKFFNISILVTVIIVIFGCQHVAGPGGVPVFGRSEL